MTLQDFATQGGTSHRSTGKKERQVETGEKEKERARQRGRLTGIRRVTEISRLREISRAAKQSIREKMWVGGGTLYEQ